MKQKLIKTITLLTFTGLIVAFVMYQSTKQNDNSSEKATVKEQGLEKTSEKEMKDTISKKQNNQPEQEVPLKEQITTSGEGKKANATISENEKSPVIKNKDEDLKIMYGSKSGIMFTPQKDSIKHRKP